MHPFYLRGAYRAREWAGESGEGAKDWLDEAAKYPESEPVPYTDWAAQSARQAGHWALIAMDPTRRWNCQSDPARTSI